jgi:ABC-type Fe3+ transport system permease subunit
MIAPVPFAMASRHPNDRARWAALATTRIGIAASVILCVIGVVLALRAARAGDGHAKVLALEAILAAMPAALVAASWMLGSASA